MSNYFRSKLESEMSRGTKESKDKIAEFWRSFFSMISFPMKSVYLPDGLWRPKKLESYVDTLKKWQ